MINLKYVLTLFLLFSIIVKSQEHQELTFEKFTQIIKQTNESPFVNLLLMFDTAKQGGKQLRAAIPKITEKRQNYFKVNYLDCNTKDQKVLKSLPYCTKQYRDKLPALIYTEPTLSSTGQSKQHQFQGSLTEKSLFQFAQPLMKAFSVNLKKVRDFSQFKQKNAKVPNIIYFTQKQKLPTIYKALTANFRKTIAFAHVQKDSPLAEHFNIQKFPTILLNGKNQIALSKDLNQMIQRLEVIKGEQTEIEISQIQSGTIQQLTNQNIQKLVFQLPDHILIHVNSQNGQIHPEWKKCQESFKKMFIYYQTDTLAKVLGVKQTPAIVYFPKSLAKKNVQKTVFYSKDTLRDIYDQISSLIQDFTVPLINDMQMQKLTSLPLQEGKFVAVLFHEEDISLSYRVLSNNEKFKNDIVFFRMRQPEESVLKKFQIKKLPALYVMTNDKSQKEGKPKDDEDLPEGKMMMNLQIAQYTGKYNYDDLSKYLNMFVEKPQQSQQKATQSTSTQGNLYEIQTKRQFKRHCLQQNCYILLVDGRQKTRQTNQGYKKQIKHIAGRINQPFTVIDGLCHSQILAPLEIQQQELPTFIHFNSKFQKFSRIVGRIQQKTLNSFIAKVRANKSLSRGYSNIKFDQEKDCLEQHNKITSYELGANAQALDQNDIQILKQIKEQQEKKKQQMQKLQKEQNKKKRKRRPKNQDNSDQL